MQFHRRALWPSEKAPGFLAAGADGRRIARAGGPENIVVHTVRLRDYPDRPVDFLKLDIEGAEAEVVTGCADLLHGA